MKGQFWLAVIGAAFMSSGASALTIVQTDSEARQAGFAAFDSAKGTLNSVTLGVDVSKSRVWQVSVPVAQRGTSATIGWNVDGTWELGSSVAAFDGLLVPIVGSGNDTIRFDRISGDGERSFGYFDVAATGSRTFTLDRSKFTGGRVSFNGFDPGYYGNVGDTMLSNLPANASVSQLSRACFVSTSGNPAGIDNEDACGGVRYTLTYDYTPAVPEPGTWALMLAGFATTGAALRRRRQQTATA